MIAGQVELDKLREFNVADLLGRRPVEHRPARRSPTSSPARSSWSPVPAAPSAPSWPVRCDLLGPSRLVLLDRDESALHAVQLLLYGSGLLDRDDLVLCDIRDDAALERVFAHHRPDVVFHAAALKHLPMLERYPEEGWKTNVIGSLNVLAAGQADGRAPLREHLDRQGGRRHERPRPDQAARPSGSPRGTPRRPACPTSRSASATSSARAGSVLDAFRAQIDRGGPVTVTHPDVTRFFMTIPEACELVLQAGAIGQPGDVLVLDMGEPVRIVDVARRLIDESRRDIDIEYTGLRQGEKLHEVLLSAHEKGTPSRHPLITQVSVPSLDPVEVLVDDAAHRPHRRPAAAPDVGAGPPGRARARPRRGRSGERAPAATSRMPSSRSSGWGTSGCRSPSSSAGLARSSATTSTAPGSRS